MALVNRDKDASEQKDEWQAITPLVGTGASVLICAMPYPAILKGVFVGALGVSGSPTWQINTVRFAGGLTTIASGISTLAVQAFGTSGMQGVSGLAAQSSTLALLQAGDMISIVSGGANSAVSSAAVTVVVQKTQDIVSQFGITG